jgi:tetratricopeptide (TPR) repeat protein
MKLQTLAVMALALAVASPVLADKKVDDAVARALDQIEKGRSEDALKTMQKLVSQSPTVDAYAALARIQQRTGNIGEAAATAAKAVASASAPADKAEALAVQSTYDLLTGTGKDALARAQQAVGLAATPTTLAAQARAQARTGDTAGAVASADRAVAAGATSAVAHAARGEALLAAGRAGEATEAFRKALAQDAKLPGARAGLALALLAENKATDALAEAKAATEQDPNSPESFAALGLAVLAANPKNVNEAIEHAQQGVFLAGQQGAKLPQVHYAVGRVFEAMTNFQQAKAAYDRALADDPGFALARTAAVHLQVVQGTGDPAEVCRVASQSPNDGELQLLCGNLLARKDDYAGAEGPLGHAVELLPNNGEAWFLRGYTLMQLGRLPDAVTAYKHAVTLVPGNVTRRATYGLLLGITGQHDAGIAELKKVVDTPGYKEPDAWMNLGYVYRSATPKQLDASIAAYKKALELAPKNADAARGLGMAYASKHEWDQAISSFNTAQGIDPKLAGDANARIAWAYLGKRDADQAQAFADKAKAAGKTDARLFDSIAKLRKGLAAEEAADDEPPPVPRAAPVRNAQTLGDICLRGGGGMSRAEACSGLVQYGGAGVNTLVNVARTPGDVSVRVSAVNALAAIGGPAKSAAPYLKQLLDALTPAGMPTAAQEQEMARTQPLRRALALAIDRLR